VESIYYANTNQQNAGATILLLGKLDCKTKNIMRVKVHFIIINMSAHPEEIILKIYILNKHIKQKLLELPREISKITTKDFAVSN
jgi:hypothetical protein